MSESIDDRSPNADAARRPIQIRLARESINDII